MKFGLALPYNVTREMSRVAKVVEDAGWDGIFLGDAIWTEDPMIALAVAAASTKTVRLGTMVTPVPLRRPWKLASESLALDRLSDGRMTLGLAAGAVWMGWQGFPDEVTDTRARAEMLDEMIDILTLLYQRKQFDYDGKHYHLKLTQVEEMHYPPKPVQQPRIPLWVVGIWPSRKSMNRVLKCDGLIAEKRSEDGSPQDVTPEDIREMKAYVEANRTMTTPFDIVVNGSMRNMDEGQAQDAVREWQDAGVTWWIEGLWEVAEDGLEEIIRKGPPVSLA